MSHRNPVAGSQMRLRLPCIDFSPDGTRTGTKCRDAFEQLRSLRGKHRFKCPGGCPRGDFCYPRQFENGRPHFHQGIDLGAPTGQPILSVSDGVVVGRKRSKTYGNIVAVRSLLPDGRQVVFFYAHCHEVLVAKTGLSVVQQQPIATVGATGNVGKIPPHLHFEVVFSSHKELIPTVTGFVPETTLDTPGPRLDPLEILELLGPWGMTFVAMPTAALVESSGELRGEPLLSKVVPAMHWQLASLSAGQFPLGANNTWHGGVHLPLKAPGQTVVAPFDGEIVALRLDDDASSSTGMYGTTNFLLLRHELSEYVARMFKGKHPTDDDDPSSPRKSKKKKSPSVGPGATNDPEDVIAVKNALRNRFDKAGTPFYNPANLDALMDGGTDAELFDAISRFQASLPRPKKMKKSHPWPDGVITREGYTWNALVGKKKKPEAPPPPPEEPRTDPDVPSGPEVPTKEGGDTTEPAQRELDPKRIVYSLLMHLGASSVGAQAKMPWVGRAKVPPRPGNADEEAIARAKRDREDDEAEGHELKLKKQVGFPRDAQDETAAGEPEEIKWVQRRLVRFGYFAGEVDGIWTEDLRGAIAAFQGDYVDYYATGEHGEAPGYVTPKGDTAAALRKPKWKLDGEAAGGKIDSLLLARASARDEHGRAEVVSGLAIPVRAGEPLWPGGQVTIAVDGTLETKDQIHFEVFSEPSVTNWPELVDSTQDLVVDDVPDALFAAVEIVPGFAKDRRLEAGELQAFYADERSHFLRRTQCRFRSEWAVDIPGWIARLDDLGVDTSGIREALEAHVMWDAAADVLPSSSHVWHYHPVEFLGRYAEIVEILRPRPPEPRGKCRVDVQVQFSDGQPWSGAHVQLAMVGEPGATATADVYGVARFYEVHVGAGIAFIDEHVDAAAFVDVEPGEATVAATIVAPIAGPDVATALLHVRLVGAGGAPVPDAEVFLVGDAELGPIASDADGVVTFGPLDPGEYSVNCRSVSSLSLELQAGTRSEVVLELGVGAIALAVNFSNGTPARGLLVYAQLVEVDGREREPDERSTDDDGFASFEVVAGDYEVWVHGIPEAYENLEVEVDMTTPVSLVVPHAPVPAPDTPDVGAVDVFVLDALGVPRAGELVWLLDDANQQIASARTDGGGRCRFDELAEGTYGISAEHGKADELGVVVKAGEAIQVSVRFGPSQKPADVKPTGNLLVTVVYEDGADFDGTLKITRRDYTRLVSERMTGSFKRVDGVEAGPIVVYVDGYEQEVRIDLPADVDVPIMLLLPGL